MHTHNICFLTRGDQVLLLNRAFAPFMGMWNGVGGKPGGMYAFVAELPEGAGLAAPRATPEGVLDWKDLSWVLDPENLGVISNIRRFLPAMLAGGTSVEHHFRYVAGEIREYRYRPLSESEFSSFDFSRSIEEEHGNLQANREFTGPVCPKAGCF